MPDSSVLLNWPLSVEESSRSLETSWDAPYTAIWQGSNPSEGRWIREMLGPFLGEWVVDGERQVVRDHAIIFDHFITARDRGYYARFRGLDAILVDFSDENYDFDPEIYAYFRGVIRGGHWASVFRADKVEFLPLGYTANLKLPDAPVKRSTERQYAWSFLGQVNKASRPDMARELARIEPHLLFATDKVPGLGMFNRTPEGNRRYSQAENTEILLNSVFAPCPMGNVNLECFRVYEALACGTIPIVEKRITLDYFREIWGQDHPVPTVSSWAAAGKLIRHLLDRPAEINLLQQRCTEWWERYRENRTQQLGDFLARRSADPTVLEADDLVYPRFRLPGWKVAELVRHHDLRALSRRVERQVTRLLTSGKLRVAATGSARRT
jgi:hypothetical protein